jgi:hypothetical protein
MRQGTAGFERVEAVVDDSALTRSTEQIISNKPYAIDYDEIYLEHAQEIVSI